MATEISQPQLLEKIGITHAGTYCLLCGNYFHPKNWRKHFTHSHSSIRLSTRMNNIAKILEDRVRLMVERYHPSISAVRLTLYTRIQCLRCGSNFRSNSKFQEHISSSNNNCIDGTPSRVPCLLLKCGRYYPQPQNAQQPAFSRPASSQPTKFAASPTNHDSLKRQTTKTAISPVLLKTPKPALPFDVSTGVGAKVTPNGADNSLTPTEQTAIPTSDALSYLEFFRSLPRNVCVPSSDIEDVLKKLVSPGEVTDQWIKIFHKYIAIHSVPTFIDTLRDRLQIPRLKPAIGLANLPHLAWAMDCYIELEKHTKAIVNGMPANWKAALVKFNATIDKGTDLEGATTWTFRYRNNSSPQLNEFAHLLCYLDYCKCPILQRYASLERGHSNMPLSSKMGLIARFIYELTVERVSNGDYIPWICHYSLFRFFTLDKGQPKLRSPNVCSRILATNLYTMRLGVLSCGYMMMHGGHSEQVIAMFTVVQNSHAINMICPWISYCRVMDERSSEKKTSHLAANGDIICMNATFRRCIYSQLIPLVRTEICNIYAVMFATSDWRKFIDKRNKICVSDSSCTGSICPWIQCFSTKG